MFSLGIQLYSIIYIYYNIDRETERVKPPKITHLTLPLFSNSDFTFPSLFGGCKENNRLSQWISAMARSGPPFCLLPTCDQVDASRSGGFTRGATEGDEDG